MYRGLNPDEIPYKFALMYAENLEGLLDREQNVLAAAVAKAFGG